ncbi:MAG: hypothetical protein Q9212_003230 [Teloschistes hypoglaucus]
MAKEQVEARPLVSPDVSVVDQDLPEQPRQKHMTRAQTKIWKQDPTAHNFQCTTLAKNPLPRLKKLPFPFLNLPTELRIKIYHETLTYDHILVHRPTARGRGAAAFLITNRLIYSEAFPIFYDVNVFQVHIDGLPSSTETKVANVEHMRQCCLELEILPMPFNPRKVAKPKKENKDQDGKNGKEVMEVPRETVIRKLLNKFLEAIWRGKIECLLIDVREHPGQQCSIELLEKFTWLCSVHLVQVVVSTIKPEGEVIQFQDYWCQRLEQEMMLPQYKYEKQDASDGYIATPQLGINLVGEELEVARKEGGWIIGDNDLFVAFGKSWVPAKK